ncbi:MAG: DinB family protein [Asticcacaulis sp.]
MDVTLKALADFPDVLAAHFGAFAPRFRQWAPPSWAGSPSENFTALEQICHVRDIETDGYHVRFRRTLSESRPFLGGVDGNILRDERDYAHADPEKVMADFRSARSYTLGLLSSLDEDDWNRPAEFEDYGPTTMRGLMHYLCSHDAQHLSGLQWLLGKTLAGG